MSIAARAQLPREDASLQMPLVGFEQVGPGSAHDDAQVGKELRQRLAGAARRCGRLAG